MNAEEFLNVLERQDFFDFYNGDFEAYLTRDEGCKSKEEIIAQINRLFFRKARKKAKAL